VRVIVWTAADPLRNRNRNLLAREFFMSVANFRSFFFPKPAVAGSLTNQRVGDFMQQHLLNGI
jgi:hypothetical protein